MIWFACTAVASIAVVLLGVMFSPGFRDGDRLLVALERHRVVLTMADGTAFEGVLFDADHTSVELRDASALGRDGEKTPADGSVFIPRAQIAYLQRP